MKTKTKTKKKTNFFKKLKYAIFNFEKYRIFAEEKVKDSIKYFLKLTAILSLLFVIAALILVNPYVNKGKEFLKNEIPEFKFENNILIAESEFEYKSEDDAIGIIINSEKEDNGKENIDIYQVGLEFDKTKVISKRSDGSLMLLDYEKIAEKVDLNNVNKDSILQYFENNKIKIYIGLAFLTFICIYLAIITDSILNVFLLSLMGWLTSKIINIRFKYKVTFNMSVYAITLSTIFLTIYYTAQIFFGFNLKYFDIAYSAIAYVYLVTAMLIIKSDLIKEQIELAKIAKEQKKINEEQEDKKEKEQEEKEEEQKSEKNDTSKEKETSTTENTKTEENN